VTRSRLLAAGATLSFAVGFSLLAVLQHRAFWTGRFDVGNLVQAVWSTAHGDLLSMTDLQGRQFSRLGAHFDPFLVVLVPLWWAWPDPAALLVAQAVGVALGAIPVYLLARRHHRSERAGAVFAVVYLLYPATQWLVVDDFHPVAFAAPLLLGCIWFLDAGRLVPFAVCAALACTTKEHVGLTIAAMGIWLAIARGRRLVGAAVAIAGVAASLVTTQVVVPHYAPGGGSPFEGRYAAVGGSPGGMVRTLLTDPGAILDAIAEGRDLRYVAALLLPLLACALLAPGLAAIALPELALNVLSATPTQSSIHFHYTATIIPALVAAAAVGTGRLRWGRARRIAPAALVVSALLAGVVLGPSPLWRHVPLGSKLATRDHVVTAHARVATAALALVPPEEPVSATNTLGAHLSERRRVFSFPVLREARWVVVDRQRPSYLDRAVAPELFAEALARLRASGAFRVRFDRDGLLVLERIGPAPVDGS
jgi:uncharacterized membrane protein